MNKWLQYSIEYANQRSYLDDLFRVYPTMPDGLREIDTEKWNEIEKAFCDKNNEQLVRSLLAMDLFPIKDSYIAYLRNDKSAIERNPNTINRISGRLYELGLNKLYEHCSQPKETNRQIGPMFKEWVRSKALGIAPVGLEEFTQTTDNAILDASDTAMMRFAQEQLNYQREKGLDFVARFNGKYVIGEAKFLTDFGGHPNAQFNDAISTIETPDVKAVKVAILDGVLYINGHNKMHRAITEHYADYNIMSALVLRNFLYEL